MTNKQAEREERFRVVLGLSAAGITYEDMARYVGVGTRQRVQQLVVSAVDKLPELAVRLGVTGRRKLGRRRKREQAPTTRRTVKTSKRSAPRASSIEKHLATARELLSQNDGRFPGATEMLRSGHGALYQFMRKYPRDFQRLSDERSAASAESRSRYHRHRRRRFRPRT